MLQNVEYTYIETNGVRLHVAQAGPENGRLVILLHGFPEAHWSWRYQIDVLAEAGYRVMAPDQRGYNLSDKPQDVAAYKLDTLVDDVVGLIEYAGREKAYIVGHDWGGAVAWWLAAKQPERVQQLAILNVPHPIVMGRTIRSSWTQRRKSWYMYAFQIPRLPEFVARRNNWRRLVDGMQGHSVPGTFSDADMDRYRKAWAQPGAITGMINWYRAMWQAQAERLESVRIKVPTLLIWGLRDHVLGSEMIEPSVALCDNGRVEKIAEATHWIQNEFPERVTTLLLEFVEESHLQNTD